MTTNSTITPELLDQLLANYEKPEDLTGEDGLFKQLKKALIERALGAELTEHLGYEKGDPGGRRSGNSRNGTSAKTILTEDGEIDIAVPRDRAGSFEPHCTLDNVRIAVFATQIPGYDGAVVGGNIYPVRIPVLGYIGDVRVYDDGTQIANETMFGHALYYGYIVRDIQVTAEGIYLRTFGEGINYNEQIAAANQTFGYTLWTQQDPLARSYFDIRVNNRW